MDNSKHGGPAFPNEGYARHKGMSLRDYFAAKALTMVGATNTQADLETWDYHHFAEYAYRMADAMLAERAK